MKKLNFKSVVALVIGSQIGSGVFLLPASLAAIGPISLFGWLISGIGAILLALVFAKLSMLSSKGGGPHVYVEMAFGRKAAFFTAWTYWVVSWVSSIAVIIAAVSYISPLLGLKDPIALLLFEIGILTAITLINLRGTVFAGSLEIFLTIMKCIPLLIIPLVGLFYLKPEYFTPLNPKNLPVSGCLNTATLMTFWGFVGLETATTTSNLIENPKKVIPRAVIFGTLLVAAIYLLNSIGLMGIIPNETLSCSGAPYVDATKCLFGNGWHLAIAIVAFIACIGTLNAWVLTSGQIASEAAKDGLFPPFFSKANQRGAPQASLLTAYFCTIPLLALTLSPNILEQLNAIIDISVTAFLFIYLACTIAFIKLTTSKGAIAVAVLAACFCLWVLLFSSGPKLLLCSLFALSGLPIYFRARLRVRRAS